MPRYNPHDIEPRWQTYWEREETFKVERDPSKEKKYVLDMFPYPSGAGLHVGHPEGYTATDILCRWWRMQGFNVLHPMGWDAFGLPAERAAVRENIHPAIITRRNIDNFRGQIKRLGFSYDWSREVSTSDASYYRWTQWIFTQLHERGLAYQAEVPVNWCPALGTVLANEEVKDGVYVETGDPVEKRVMKQWMLKITVYAERLLADLETLDWPESIKKQQRDWIGRSEGARLAFAVQGHEGLDFEVFTTRPDTLFGCTYCVLAPEHALVSRITSDDQREAVTAYVEAAGRKSERDRTATNEKTGVFTGAYAINPVNGQPVPIWVADYVLASYGTGAIMAVPAHDERDYAFAQTFALPIVEVISGGDISQAAHTGDGVLVNSGFLDGLAVKASKAKMIAWLEEQKLGRGEVNYRLRDWLFSRQRYWGEPFPVVHMDDGSVKLLDGLVELPHQEQFTPTSDGQPPLARSTEWLRYTDPETGAQGWRETNTMPQWAGSCWYYLRFMDPANSEAAWSSEAEQYWGPVDLYVGGAEHAVLHLLYARFWHKVLFDLGLVSTIEPFQKLFNQGMILAYSYRNAQGKYFHPSQVVEQEDGSWVTKDGGEPVETQVEKMSKSRYNVVNPDDVVAEYGADSLRLYEMFMGPLEASAPWQMAGVDGVRRFLDRVWRLVVDEDAEELRPNPKLTDAAPSRELAGVLHRTIRKVHQDLDGMRFNTAIAAMMSLVSECIKQKQLPRSVAETLVLLVSPFAPHIGEELWRVLGHTDSLAYHPWPQWDEALCKKDQITFVVQVKGKLRGRLTIDADADKDTILAAARTEPNVARWLEGKTIVREIYVPGRLVNFIVR